MKHGSVDGRKARCCCQRPSIQTRPEHHEVYDRRGKVTTTLRSARPQAFIGYGTVAGSNPTTYESTVTQTYDAGDRRTKAVDTKAGTVTYTHDGLDRILSEVSPQGTISYTYDAAGRRTGMSASGQAAITYTYDDANRVTGVTQGTNNVGLSYDASGRRSALTLPNGVVVEYGYSRASQINSLKFKRGAELLGDLLYEYDAAGRRVKVGGSYSLTELPQPLTSAAHNAANQLTQRGGANLTYDANGNLTSDGTNTYTWDARNALASIGGGTTPLPYDVWFRRSVSKTVCGRRRSISTTAASHTGEGRRSPSRMDGRLDESFSLKPPRAQQSLFSDAGHDAALWMRGHGN